MSDIDIITRVEDALRLCEMRSIPKFVGFLSPSQVAEALPVLSQKRYGIYGGYNGAERSYIGIFPEWCDQETEPYPIKAITFTYRPQYTLCHRDFLGAVLNLGLQRSAIGDILIESGRAVMFASADITDYVISQLDKVGRVGGTLTEGYVGELPGRGQLVECSATVASLRLDCVVGALTGKSRSGSVELISAALVTVNSVAVGKPTYTVKCGDTLSVRGYGKFSIIASHEQSKKGRIILRWQKYT